MRGGRIPPRTRGCSWSRSGFLAFPPHPIPEGCLPQDLRAEWGTSPSLSKALVPQEALTAGYSSASAATSRLLAVTARGRKPSYLLPLPVGSVLRFSAKGFRPFRAQVSTCNGCVFGGEEDRVCDWKRKEAGGGIVGCGDPLGDGWYGAYRAFLTREAWERRQKTAGVGPSGKVG